MISFPNVSALSFFEECECVVLAKNGDQRAVEKLILSNIPFIIMSTRKFRGKGLTDDELVEEGILGFIDAIKRFDVSKGFRLRTYAKFWIMCSIQKALYHYDNVPVVSLDEPVGNAGEEVSRLSILSDDANSLPEDSCIDTMMKEQILKAVYSLNPSEREIVCMHFGLGKFSKPMSFSDIARVKGRTKARMQQIEQSAFKQLRASLCALVV